MCVVSLFNISSMWQLYFILSLFLITIIGLIRYPSQPERIFGVLLLVLYSLGLVNTQQVISSFANQGLLTLMLLMSCSIALEKTRILQKIANFVVKPSYGKTWLRLFMVTTSASAFLNNTAVVSTLLGPLRNNAYHPIGKLLIPLSYFAILGGTLTLVGTSTNLIVNSMVIDLGIKPLSFFDFTLVGLCLVFGCGAVLFLLHPCLPAHYLKAKEAAEYFIDSEVLANSSLIGKTVEENGLRNLDSLFLVEVIREHRLISPVAPDEVLQQGDRLLFSGDIHKVTVLNHFDGLSLFAHQNGLPIDNLTEVVIRPDSILVGQTLKCAGFRALFDAAVVGMKRDGESVSGKLGEVVMQSGDCLILAVGADFKHRRNISKNFIIISGVDTEHKLTGSKELGAVIGFGVAMLLAALGILPLFQTMLLLLGGLILSGCLSTNEVIQRLPKQIWLIISTALLLSQALMNQGFHQFLSSLIMNYQHTFTPFIGLILIYTLTWLLTELVTNNAAAALVMPIAYGVSISLDANLHSFVLAVAFGASASFISPYGYQTNLMVYNAGQYRLKDFIKVGLPVSLCYGTIVILTISFLYGL